MPILLDDINSTVSAQAKQTNTPHFFSQQLTGQGKTTGLINQHFRPGRYALGQSAQTMDTALTDAKSKSSSSSVVVRTIPFAPLTRATTIDAVRSHRMVDVPATSDRFHVTAHATALDFDVYVDMTPQGGILHENGSGSKMIRHLDVNYRMEVYVLKAGSTTKRVPWFETAPSLARVKDAAGKAVPVEFAVVEWSYAPLDDIEGLIKSATRALSPNGNGVFIDVTELATWMADYDVYDRICRQADIWNGAGIGEIVSEHITTLFAGGEPSGEVLNRLALQLRYLETYNVPLDGYRKIYDTLRATCSPNIAEILAKQNLNLLMNGTLADLDVLRSQLAVPPANQQAAASLPSKFSKQQRDAITTTEPLSMTTAGAGTGKSTTILARIDYLTACGIAPEEITVLSFTNAAADNILAKNPKVGSMTIARMVLEIYKINYPTHQISTIDTMVNTMDIIYPNDDLVRAFRRRLVEVDKNNEGATTALNTFVEQHFDRVIEVLNRIEQTCLELQIIIAYQQIDSMVEPPHLAGKFLIVDEVQDNSIFEFIYLLRYVTKHLQNMFIVGDASQTLYEFRSANPKALNALEGSGVFTTYRLTTNYRSNQEILDFANVHLADIEANSLSQIRLQANSLAQPTAKSFQDRVRLHYTVTPSQVKYMSDLPGLMVNVVRPYVDECLARGEKVAFLAYRGKQEVDVFEKLLEDLYPSQQIANITSKRRRPTTIFSQFVKTFWNDVLQVQPGDAALVVSRGILDNLDQLVGRNAVNARPVITKMVSDWWIDQAANINGWVHLVNAGGMNRDEFFGHLMHNLLDYEIDQNGIKQAVLNLQNRKRKEMNQQQNANLIVSTIHGAKGLEFDNVVVLHAYDTQLPEDRKRMYYVAFTRAMKSELVLSFGKQKGPRIKTDYELIVNALHKREQLDVLRAQGVDIDAMTEEELEQTLASMVANQTAADDREPASVP